MPASYAERRQDLSFSEEITETRLSKALLNEHFFRNRVRTIGDLKDHIETFGLSSIPKLSYGGLARLNTLLEEHSIEGIKVGGAKTKIGDLRKYGLEPAVTLEAKVRSQSE